MSSISDFKKWEWFQLNELFDIKGSKTTQSEKLNGAGNGNYFYVTTQATNNGVAGSSDFYTENGNVLTIDSAVIGYCSYQPKNFIASDHVEKLIPKFELNKYVGLFLATIINNEQYRYNYGRKAAQIRLQLAKIKLPVKNGEPDWAGMEEYIKSLPFFNYVDFEDLSSFKYPVSLNNLSLKSENWKQFKLDELFEIKKGKRLTKEDMTNGQTPFIGAIDSNNGYREFIGEAANHTGNTITVNYNGSVAEAFYQPVSFWASDDVNVLYPKFLMSIYSAMFLCTVIKQEKYRFNYGRKWNKERMEKSDISLPAVDGKPDFKFMEDYIKSLPYSSALIKKFTKVQDSKPVKKERVEKGLSDEELVKKYESGQINFSKLITPLLNKS